MAYKFKLGATITLDERQEEDIINTLNSLKSRHKLGEYTSALYRVAANNPEVAELVKNELEGHLSSRDHFFSRVQEHINGCKDSIKEINTELVKIKAALLYGNRLGLTGKTDNLSISTLAVERHLNKLKKALYGNILFEEGISREDLSVNEIALEVFDILEEMLPSEQYTKDMQESGLLSHTQVQAIHNPSMVDPNTNTIIQSNNNVVSAPQNVQNFNNSSQVLDMKENNNNSVGVNIDGSSKDDVVEEEVAPDIHGLFALCGVN